MLVLADWLDLYSGTELLNTYKRMDIRKISGKILKGGQDKSGPGNQRTG